MDYVDMIIEAAAATLVRSPGQPRTGRFTVRVFSSPSGEMTPEQATTIDYDDTQLQQRLQRLAQRALDRAGLIALGRVLADLLLPSQQAGVATGVRELLTASLAQIGPDHALRLRLRLPLQLAELPWEYFYLDRPGGGDGMDGFLALDPRIAIVRHEVFAAPIQRPLVRRPLKVVAAFASPPALPPLDLAREQADLAQMFAGQSGIAPTFLRNATLSDVQAAIVDAGIFHFAGHGTFDRQMAAQPGTYRGTGALALHDQRIDAEQFGMNLRGNGVRLAVLGGCETGRRDGFTDWSSIAAALVKAEVPAVVAHQLPISDRCAIAFSQQFYAALVGGQPIERAVTAGRIAAYNTDPAGRDWGVPVLYLRADGQLFAATDDVVRQQVELAIQELLAKAMPTPKPDAVVPAPVYFLPTHLPANYVARPEALATLREALLGEHARVSVVAATAVHGQGGLGKTVLARAICDDPAVRARFLDGILWTTLGQQADPLQRQREWIQVLRGDVAAASSVASGQHELEQLLHERTMLLIVDDVWHAIDVAAFQVDAPRCVLLYTIRDATQVADAELVPLDVLSRSESCALLLQAARGRLTDPVMAAAIAERVGDLPLALDIAGAMLASGIAWSDIVEALDEHDLAYLVHGARSVLSVIATSVDTLPPDQAARYRELVVFPPDEPLDSDAVARLWHQTDGLKPRHAHKLLADFRERALIQTSHMLHDLQYEYLHTVVRPDTQECLHGILADSYDRTTGPDDAYGWQRLAMHLASAGRAADLRDLLTNGTYLQGKIAHVGATALLADFALLPATEPLQVIAGAVRLGAHILDRAPTELTNQLQGRLGSVAMLHDLPAILPALQLRSKTLHAPGGPLLRTLAGHTLAVQACVFSPDGRLALSASRDRTLRLWDVHTGQTVHVLEGHTSAVQACVFSPDGRLALSASFDKRLRLWDVCTGQSVHVLKGHTAGVQACVFSPDGQLALSASRDRTLRLWDVSRGQSIHILKGHTAGVQACVFSPDGRLVLSASRDRTLRLWDVHTGQSVHVLKGHTAGVLACAFSPDGQLALSASDDKRLRLWDVRTGQSVHVLKGHTFDVQACVFSPDGRLALSASGDTTLRLWDVRTGQSVHVLKGHTAGVLACAFSPDGQLALSASYEEALRLWDLSSDQTVHLLQGHTSWVEACAFSPDGQLALSASFDTTLRLWDVRTGQTIHVLKGHTAEVQACALSPDGQIALSASFDKTLRLWDVRSGQSVHILRGHTAEVRACALSPDGRLALSASFDKTLRLWDVRSGQSVHILRGHTAELMACALSPDGRLALSASFDKTLRLWDVRSGQTVHVLKGHTNAVEACTFSSDGQLALSASYDETLRLWDVSTGQSVHVLKGHTAEVSACAFSPDGRLALSASMDETLRLWDLTSGAERSCWHADGNLECLAIRPDGQHIVAGDRKGGMHFLLLVRS